MSAGNPSFWGRWTSSLCLPLKWWEPAASSAASVQQKAVSWRRRGRAQAKMTIQMNMMWMRRSCQEKACCTRVHSCTITCMSVWVSMTTSRGVKFPKCHRWTEVQWYQEQVVTKDYFKSKQLNATGTNNSYLQCKTWISYANNTVNDYETADNVNTSSENHLTKSYIGLPWVQDCPCYIH